MTIKDNEVYEITKNIFGKKCALYSAVQSRGAQVFQKPGSRLKIQGSRRVPWSKRHAEDTQMSGTIVLYLVTGSKIRDVLVRSISIICDVLICVNSIIRDVLARVNSIIRDVLVGNLVVVVICGNEYLD